MENAGLTKCGSRPAPSVKAHILLGLFLPFQALLLLAAHDSHAGVIIWLEEGPHSEDGGKTQRRDHVIEIIQGHKEWISRSGARFQQIAQVKSAVIDDLDKGVRTNISYEDKTYSIQKPWPGPYAGGHPLGVGELKPTGRFRKVGGYSCQEYVGTGESTLWGPLTEVDCISHDPPGVHEYNQFMSLLNRVYEAANYSYGSLASDWPGDGSPQGIDGIALEIDGPGPFVGFVVKRIESRDIPASQFEVPAGFVGDGEAYRTYH